MKCFYVHYNYSQNRHLVSFHDGKSKHPDGSPFWDIRIFHAKKKTDAFCDELVRDGYKEGKYV